MYGAFMFLFGSILTGALGALSVYNDSENFLILCAVAGLVTASIAICALISYMSNNEYQIDDCESIKACREKRKIYKKRADDLIAEFKLYLAEIYPKFEKEIFEKISPDKVDVYMMKFPELKTSATLIELVNRINSLKNDVYKQDIEITTYRKRIRVRLRSPWLLSWFVTQPDPDLMKDVDDA